MTESDAACQGCIRPVVRSRVGFANWNPQVRSSCRQKKGNPDDHDSRHPPSTINHQPRKTVKQSHQRIRNVMLEPVRGYLRFLDVQSPDGSKHPAVMESIDPSWDGEVEQWRAGDPMSGDEELQLQGRHEDRMDPSRFGYESIKRSFWVMM